MLGGSLSFIIDWQSFCRLSTLQVSVAAELRRDSQWNPAHRLINVTDPGVAMEELSSNNLPHIVTKPVKYKRPPCKAFPANTIVRPWYGNLSLMSYLVLNSFYHTISEPIQNFIIFLPRYQKYRTGTYVELEMVEIKFFLKNNK